MQKEMYRDLERVFSTSTRIDFNGEERNGTWADFKTNYGLDLPCHAEVKHFDWDVSNQWRQSESFNSACCGYAMLKFLHGVNKFKFKKHFIVKNALQI